MDASERDVDFLTRVDRWLATADRESLDLAVIDVGAVRRLRSLLEGEAVEGWAVLVHSWPATGDAYAFATAEPTPGTTSRNNSVPATLILRAPPTDTEAG